MSNPSKAKGTRAETKVKRYFNDHGLRCERKALAGSDDEGDLRLYLDDGTEVTIEVKAGKQTINYSRAKFNEWKQQTLAEAKNSQCAALLVIVKFRRKLMDAEVWWPKPGTIEDDGTSPCWTMMYIDDFVKSIGD